MNRKYSLVVVVVLAMALTLSVGGVIAQEQGPQSPQSAIGTAFTYQGQLKNASGLVNGNCDFQFSLWDSLANATGQIGTTQSKPDITVSNGLFTVQLDFGVNAFNGDARWLQIEVSCPAGTGTYVTLVPRQSLTPAPYALYSTSTGALQGRSITTTAPATGQVLKWNGAQWSPAADAIGAPGSGDITGVYAGNGLTGGGASGEVTLTVNYAGSGVASTSAHSDHNHWGQSWSGSGTGLTLNGGMIGLSGSGDMYGVLGNSSNYGVYGSGDYGVYGEGNTGVYGYSGSHYGVSGLGNDTGVYGEGITGVAGVGTTYGVSGTGATGVRGNGTAYGVIGSGGNIGVNGSGSMYGVYGGGGTTGFGVFGVGTRGVSGNGTDVGVYGYGANIGIQGSAGSGITSTGVSGSGSIGVTGVGSSYGISGTGSGITSAGVYGTASMTGTVGIATAANGTGVYGTGRTGVMGYSPYDTGVSGSGTTGVRGSGGAFGVYGLGSGDYSIGVYGSGDETGVSGSGYFNGVKGIGIGAGSIGVRGLAAFGGLAGKFEGSVSIEGNLTATGSKSAVVKTQNYGNRALYAVESPENWFEDFGTGQLTNGQAVITIEPIFAQTVNLTDDYHIFLTPLGDCALYVKEKASTSFTVRAMNGQTCAIAFDYRIVAKRLGYEDVRLAEVDPPPMVEPPSKGAR